MGEESWQEREVCENGKDVIGVRLSNDGAVCIWWKDTGCEINLTSDEMDAVYSAFVEMAHYD